MFTFEILPRLSETDGLGHINNTVLPAWFEEARRGLFQIFNPSLSLAGWNLILKKYEVEIVSQIVHDETVEIQTEVSDIGTKSFTVSQKAFQGGRLAAVYSCLLIYFDYASGKTAAIPQEIVEKLAGHIATETT